MAHSKTTAGTSRKSHKTRKTDPVSAPDSGLPAVAAHTVTEPPSSPNPLVPVLPAVQGEGGSQPPATTQAAPTPAPEDTVPAPEPDQKQWWYRPPDSKARKVVAKILVLDAAGHNDAEIAKKLKTTPATISSYRYIAKRNGWLTTNEDGEVELVDLEAELALNIDRKVVRNIDASLDGHMTNWQTHEMTIAAAKGRGIFKNDAAKTSDTELSVVAIQVVMPPLGVANQQIDESTVGGTPAYIDAEVVQEGKQP